MRKAESGKRRALFLAAGLLAAAAAAEPGRHIEYAESADRLVYVMVFGHKDTCRVRRREKPPSFALQDFLSRPPGASYKGEPGDRLVKEFDFGSDRPVHIVPLNDGRHLLTFVNRAPAGGWPRGDRLYFLEERHYWETLDYGGLPVDPEPAWPRLARALAREKPRETKGPPLAYAFCSREFDDGRVLVGRQSEDGQGRVEEMVCFLVTPHETRVQIPAEAELLRLLRDDEPLLRAAAAWALGHGEQQAHVVPLKAALARSASGSVRAALAAAVVRCGDDAARKTLRSLLAGEDDAHGRRAAARAVALLPPDRGDADALAQALQADDPETVRFAGIALARLEGAGAAMAVRVSRSSKKELRAVAATLLGRIDDPRAEERLLRLVADAETDVQTAAAVALTRPPRAILEENYAQYARALEACRRHRNPRAISRLCKLAAHAKIRHEDVLEALVQLAPIHGEAIRSLARLTGKPFQTADEVERWWKGR